MADTEDRTQAPSERRRARARDEGQVALSRELVSMAGLAGASLFLCLEGPASASALASALRDMMVDAPVSPDTALESVMRIALAALLPLLSTVGLVGSAAVLLQTGFLINRRALVPELARLDPRRGLKRLFGLDNAVEAAKAVLKLAVLAWAAWSALSSTWSELPDSVFWLPGTLGERVGRSIVHVFLAVLAAQAAIALLDTAWVRWRFTQRLRMSREDLRQETKETDGDPRIKARVRQLRLSRARRRMLAAVAKATVVVTNPTHYAVALAYERGGAAAPRIVAKGADEVAARIRDAATKAGVPLVANPPLARALHALPLESEVPAEHFKVVAEIIAYVWRLPGRLDAQQVRR